MKNTAYFGLTHKGDLVALGYGAENNDVANALADNFETNSVANGELVTVVDPILTINDLYKLSRDIDKALNGLDNDALCGEPITFDLLVEGRL